MHGPAVPPWRSSPWVRRSCRGYPQPPAGPPPSAGLCHNPRSPGVGYAARRRAGTENTMGLTQQQWSQVERLFGDALDLAPAQRADFVGRIGAGDSVLGAELGEMLAAFDSAGDFLSGPVSVLAPESAPDALPA